MIKETLKKLDEMFPKEAPHHIVIMNDKEFKENELKNKQRYIYKNTTN